MSDDIKYERKQDRIKNLMTGEVMSFTSINAAKKASRTLRGVRVVTSKFTVTPNDPAEGIPVSSKKQPQHEWALRSNK